MPDRPTDEQLRVWSDPQCNGPWTVAMAKELLELRLAFSALRASVKCLGSVTICKKCGGTGTLPGGPAEYPAGACCRIGHATDCPCNLCAWILSGYRKDKELLETRKDTARLDYALDNLLPQSTRDELDEDMAVDAGIDARIEALEKP